MNFEAELITRVTANIRIKMASGKSFDDALIEAKKESSAGSAIWAQINKMEFIG